MARHQFPLNLSDDMILCSVLEEISQLFLLSGRLIRPIILPLLVAWRLGPEHQFSTRLQDKKSVTLRLLANFPNTTCIYNYSQANVFRKNYHFGRSYIQVTIASKLILRKEDFNMLIFFHNCLDNINLILLTDLTLLF